MSGRLAQRAAASAPDSEVPKRESSASWTQFSEAMERYLASNAGENSSLEDYLQKEIGDLLAFVRQARQDIASIEPTKIRMQHIPGATNELDAVMEATEDATGKILDAAEDIEALAAESDPTTTEKLTGIATKIYEASNFQDLTGQRICKVISILDHIESKIGELEAAFGHEDVCSLERDVTVKVDRDGIELHGPQRVENTNAQDDIDRLMAEMEANGSDTTSQDDIDKLFD